MPSIFSFRRNSSSCFGATSKLIQTLNPPPTGSPASMRLSTLVALLGILISANPAAAPGDPAAISVLSSTTFFTESEQPLKIEEIRNTSRTTTRTPAVTEIATIFSVLLSSSFFGWGGGGGCAGGGGCCCGGGGGGGGGGLRRRWLIWHLAAFPGQLRQPLSRVTTGS